jgi:hypothetical protein
MKRKTFTLMIFFIAASTLTTAGFIDLTNANSFIQSPEVLPVNRAYIRCNGSVEPPSLPIQQVGNTYRLKENLENYTFTIEKDDVVFDGNGFSLKIPAFGERGEYSMVKTHPALIEVNNHRNVTIGNFTIYHCNIPIDIFNSTKIMISQNNLTDCGPICIGQSSYCSVVNNYVRHCDDNLGSTDENGIAAYGCHHIDIRYNQILDCGFDGIWGNLSNSTIIGNTFIDNHMAAIQSLLSHNRIIGNLFQGNQFGIISHENNNEIHHNNFVGILYKDLDHLKEPNILDDGKEGNYWSSNHNSAPLTIDYGHNQSDIDHFPQVNPYKFDYQAPSIKITSLSQSSFPVNTSFSLNFTSSEEYTRASYSIDENERAPLEDSPISLVGLPLGAHQLTVYVEDEFGNEGTDTLPFTIGDQTSASTSAAAEPLSAEVFYVVLVATAILCMIIVSWIVRRKK